VIVVIAPDSFKGSLTALEAARAIEQGVRRALPDVEARLFPLADGGEGTLDAILFARHGACHTAEVRGADGELIHAAYGVIEVDGRETAVIESAQVVGLPMAGTSDVARRSTYGIGELLGHCLDRGIRRFMVGLGGSSTNDGGSGLLMALGARLTNPGGDPIDPTPTGLGDLAAVDLSPLDARLQAAEIILMTDVDNPLCGAAGATATFGPQKGVRSPDVPIFDARIASLARRCDAQVAQGFTQEPGAGAAGGLGYAFMLLGAKRRPGAEVLCELMGLDAAMRDANWAITGEGRSDAQTLHGKLPMAVAEHARRHRVPVTLISGRIDPAAQAVLESRFDGCFEAAPPPMPLAQAMRDAAQLLAQAAERATRARFGG
jgi:glycerate kinase